MKELWARLFPNPHAIEQRSGLCNLQRKTSVLIVDHTQEIFPYAHRFVEAWRAGGVDTDLTASSCHLSPLVINLAIDESVIDRPQGYCLQIEDNRITLAGRDLPGLFYGLQTLRQILQIARTNDTASVPAVILRDWPDFPYRGIMLDVSRDKVPTMDTLFQLVDKMASWKLNELQLYMEHTFAYRGHEAVWRDASPLTGEEIMALDAYCRERFVTLVPNQNSFGHMHRWLKHDAYRHLAECPGGCELWPGYFTSEPFSLCPIDAGSIDLLTDMYDQLLPHFSSRIFNVGLDETWDLGKGRSAEECAKHGAPRVYLNFLKKIHHLAGERGCRIQFWGDIILHQPDLIPELPKDAIAMEWGYEAEHPFAEHGKLFADAGLEFYVCPGTSSWNSIAGRTDNALRNIRNAAVNGMDNGATGFLNTDWGDNGHLQPLPVSYLGYMAGAGVSWNSRMRLTEAEITDALNLFAFRDVQGVMGQVAYDLGMVYEIAGGARPNVSGLFRLLLNPEIDMAEAGFSRESLTAAIDKIKQTTALRETAEMGTPDAEWVDAEFDWAANLLRTLCNFGIARLDYPERIPAELRDILILQLQSLGDYHRGLWLQRNRPGGLEDSLMRLERILKSLGSTL